MWFSITSTINNQNKWVISVMYLKFSKRIAFFLWSQSLYRIINFRGVISVHVSAVWSLKIHQRVHFFLWLLAKNKLLTRDNLSVRKKFGGC